MAAEKLLSEMTCKSVKAKSAIYYLNDGAGLRMKGKRVCRKHGGASTGPKTSEGRQRCAEARTKTGTETRKARTERALSMRRLRTLEDLGHALGIMHGARTPGRKSN